MSKRILLVGEQAIDIFVVGRCQRLSPEGPVPVCEPIDVQTNDGMAGNVKANILSLSPDSVIDHFHQSKEIVKIRYVDDASGQQLLRVDEGNDAFEPDFSTKLIAGMAASRGTYQAIVISDYGKGLLSINLMSWLAQVGRDLGIPTFCDTKAILGKWSKEIDFVKINEKEYKAQLAAGVKEPWKWCKTLIVTRGKHGADIYNNDGSIAYHSDSRAGKIWNVSGGGDTVLAALVVKYLTNNGNVRTALDYAMKAAAVAVSRPGVVAVTWQEIEDLA